MSRRALDFAGPVLRAAREGAGVTQREVADRAGASNATISRLENGLAWPSDRLGDAVLDAYSVLTGVPRLELMERTTAEWQREEYGNTPRSAPPGS